MSQDFTKSHFETQRAAQREKRQKRERERFRAALDAAHELLEQEQFGELLAVVTDELLPMMSVRYTDVGQMERSLDDDLELAFDSSLLRGLLSTGRLSLDRVRAERLLETVEAVGVHEGLIPKALRDGQEVREYEHTVGVRHLSKGFNVNPVVQAANLDGDWESILFAGSTGSGKSASLGTVIEDRIAAGHKVVDLVEFNKAENAVYDIPAQHELADIRDEMGFDVGFEEYDKPDVEILVPLTRDLKDVQIPATQDGKTVVRPFTVPASDLTMRQLVLLLPHTTDVWENAIESAYQRLDRKEDDWTLRDLSAQVQQDPKQQPDVKQKVASALETVQNKGFIRDRSCPHSLAWDDLLDDPDTVTAFTLFQVQSELDKKLIAAYLIDALAAARDRLHRTGRLREFPPLSVVMREMHYVAPRNKSEHDAQASAEKMMVEKLAEFFSVMRHANAEILADTQKYYRQLHPNVSGHFDRVYAFGGHKRDIKHILNTRESPSGSPEEQIARYDNGECCLVSSRHGYVMPIQFVPPRFHHLDSQEDGDGFTFRAEVDVTDEELQPVPWDTDVPAKFRFETTKSKHPVEKFCDLAVEQTGDRNDYVFKDELRAAYHEWADENDYPQFDPSKFGRLVKRFLDLGDDTAARLTRGDKQVRANRTIRLLPQYDIESDEHQAANRTKAQ